MVAVWDSTSIWDTDTFRNLFAQHGAIIWQPRLREAIAETHELLKQPYLAIAPPANLSSLKRVAWTACQPSTNKIDDLDEMGYE